MNRETTVQTVKMVTMAAAALAACAVLTGFSTSGARSSASGDRSEVSRPQAVPMFGHATASQIVAVATPEPAERAIIVQEPKPDDAGRMSISAPEPARLSASEQGSPVPSPKPTPEA